MPTVPVINQRGAGIDATDSGGITGALLGLGMRAGSMGTSAEDRSTPETDAAFATAFGLPGAPKPKADENSSEIRTLSDLVTATQHLPAAQRAQIQMQALSAPAAWGAKTAEEK